MTDEEKLKEIRRARELGILPWSHLSNPTQRFEVARDTLDFLLSLVKSQEEEISLLRIATADPADKEYGTTVYDGNGNYSVLAQNAINRNVELMRSACVEKVKSMERSVTGLSFDTQDAVIEAIHRRNAILGEVVIELESLSIQEQEK